MIKRVGIIVLSILIFIIMNGISNVDIHRVSAQDEINTTDEENILKTDIAQVYISTNNIICKEEYVDAKIAIVDAEGERYESIRDDNAKIKIRGNSTSGLQKLPYNIKFSSSQRVLGMGSGKKWCMLANYLDTTLIRNKLAYDFAKNIGMTYNCETRYVDVWLNGSYQGNYLITVPVETGKNRVDINTKEKEYLLELDAGRVEKDVIYFNTGIYRFKIDEPEKLTKDQQDWLNDFLFKAEAGLKSGSYSKVKKYFDMDSFVKFYIVQELFKNLDVNTSSTRFYIMKDKIYAGPLWDCDLTCGNVSLYSSYTNHLIYNNYGAFGNSSGNSFEGFWALYSGYKQNYENSWIGMLMRYDIFRTLFNQSYLSLQEQIINLYQDNTIGINQIDSLCNQYCNSFKRDNDKWPVNKYRGSELYRNVESTYQDSLSFLKSWLMERNKWLNKSLTENKYTVTFEANGGKMKVKNKTVVNECFYGALPKPYKKGYTFVGWYTSTKNGINIKEDTVVVLMNSQTLYAKWKKLYKSNK